MNAAERLFVEKGIGAASVDDIVAAADVAKGTFYLYFDSKDGLLAALQERFVAVTCDRLRAALDACRPDDWAGKLQAWVDAGVDAYLDRVALHDVVFHEYRPKDRRIKHDNAIVSLLAGLLERGAGAKAWEVDDPRLAAVFLFNVLHAGVDDAIVRGGPIDRERLRHMIAAFFGRVLGQAPATA